MPILADVIDTAGSVGIRTDANTNRAWDFERSEWAAFALWGQRYFSGARWLELTIDYRGTTAGAAPSILGDLRLHTHIPEPVTVILLGFGLGALGLGRVF